MGKLPVKWTKETVTLAGADLSGQAKTFPALMYPNPLHPVEVRGAEHGLTIMDREYNGDYGMPHGATTRS